MTIPHRGPLFTAVKQAPAAPLTEDILRGVCAQNDISSGKLTFPLLGDGTQYGLRNKGQDGTRNAGVTTSLSATQSTRPVSASTSLQSEFPVLQRLDSIVQSLDIAALDLDSGTVDATFQSAGYEAPPCDSSPDPVTYFHQRPELFPVFLQIAKNDDIISTVLATSMLAACDQATIQLSHGLTTRAQVKEQLLILKALSGTADLSRVLALLNPRLETAVHDLKQLSKDNTVYLEEVCNHLMQYRADLTYVLAIITVVTEQAQDLHLSLPIIPKAQMPTVTARPNAKIIRQVPGAYAFPELDLLLAPGNAFKKIQINNLSTLIDHLIYLGISEAVLRIIAGKCKFLSVPGNNLQLHTFIYHLLNNTKNEEYYLPEIIYEVAKLYADTDIVFAEYKLIYEAL